MDQEREVVEFDVLFVGGGPSALAGAIKLRQLCREFDKNIEVAVIEKGAEIGNHSISGAILNPVALKELLPDYKNLDYPLSNPVSGDEFYFLTGRQAYKIPIVPRYLHNKGYDVISLSRFTSWLAHQAEELDINIFTGFSGDSVIYNKDNGAIIGVRCGSKGLCADGTPSANFELELDIHAKITVFAEGARGSLFKQIDDVKGLSNSLTPQVYEVGIKEVIELPENNYFSDRETSDIHTMGYPVGLNIPGGGFIYSTEHNTISLGFLVALNYDDPHLDPYLKFMEYKQHPFISKIISGGKVLEQGSRTVSTGGYYTIPKLVTDGGLFIGNCAAIHNPHEIKGIHSAMKTGMLAAETIFEAFEKNDFTQQMLTSYPKAFDQSWVKQEMYSGRNFTQALSKKGFRKLIHLGAQYVTKGHGFIDQMKMEADFCTLKEKPNHEFPESDNISYDGELYLDKLTGVYLSKTKHREDQPCHLIITDRKLCINVCYPKYQCPCTRFCPARVYEIETDEQSGELHLLINPSNCLHCKTCDIKDPLQNITWTCPEGGGGPAYTMV